MAQVTVLAAKAYFPRGGGLTKKLMIHILSCGLSFPH
jgi:hypothetical protein